MCPYKECLYCTVYLAKKRKINLGNKRMLSAVLIALFLVGMMNLASVSSATAPQSSHVNMGIYLYSGGSQIGFLNNPTVYINSTAGSNSQTVVGSTQNVTLNYGTYFFTVMPTTTTLHGQVYYTDKQTFTVTVGSPLLDVSKNISGISASYSTVNLSGLNGQAATIQFSTLGGYMFDQKTTNASSFKAYLPSTGDFYVNSYFSSTSNGLLSQVAVLASGNLLSLDLSTKALNYFGSVYDVKTGQSLNGFNVIAYNSSTTSYTTLGFGGNTFSVSAPTGTSFVLAAKGYSPMLVSSANSYGLTQSSSYVYTNYSLGKNLQNVTITTHYAIQGTAFPGFSDAGVSYLPYQEAIANANVSTNFTTALKNFLVQSISSNTYGTFMVNGTYYNVNNSDNIVSVHVTSNSVNAYVTSVYHNSSMTSKNYTGMSLSIFMKGYSNTPSAVKYLSYVKYNNSNVSVTSGSTQITYGNPFEIYPVVSSSTVLIKFGHIQKPTFVNANLVVYYQGIKTTDSILNSSSKNAVIAVPLNQNFSLNISNAFYNPVNGKYEYNNPGVSFSWNVSGKAYNVTGKDYNVSFKLSQQITNVVITGTSSSGFTNVTNITFIAEGSTFTPFLNLSYTQNGQSHTINATTTSIKVNQDQTVTFDASKSSLNLSYLKSKYSLSLFYNWSLPNYTASGSVINYKFVNPSITAGMEFVYVNITSSVNSTLHSSLMVYVNDTTPPTPTVTLQNSTHSNVSSILAGSSMILTANYTTSKYYSFSQITFNWTFRYANGTIVTPSLNGASGNVTILGYNSSAKDWNSSNWIMVEFNTLGNMHVGLKASNPNATAYSNQSYSPSYTGPELLVSGLVYSGSFTQGTSKELSVNVTNNAKVVAKNITIYAYGGTSLIGSQTYVGVNLGKNVTRTFTVNVTIGNSGSTNISVQAGTSGQPSFVQVGGQYTATVSVGASSYKLVYVVAAIILILLIFGLIYYRITQGRFPFTGNTKKTPPTMPKTVKQTDQKPTDQPKNNKK